MTDDQILQMVPDILRTIQGDIASLRNEIRDGFARVEVRLGLVEHGLADLLSVSASDRDEIRSLKSRVERIERRLELTGGALDATP
jgi:predicted component of type VI protein secretion system